MNGTKFVVVKMKELVKTAIFAILGVIILGGLIYFFLHLGEEDSGAYRDGTYYGEIELGEERATVEVTVAEGRIAGVALQETSEAVAAFYPLLETAAEEVAKEVIANQSLTVEVSPRNAHSAQAVLNAIAESLTQAEKKYGIF